MKVAAGAQENAPVSTPAPLAEKATTTEPLKPNWRGLQPGDWFQLGGAVATAIAAGISAVALLYAARQLGVTRRIAEGQFLLDLDEMFGRHEKVHLRLIEGDWKDSNKEPETTEEKAALVAYLGLFERMSSRK